MRRREDEENNVDMDSTDLGIVDSSFNLRPNDSFQIGNTEAVDVINAINQLEMETEQNFIQKNEGMNESDVGVGEEETERLLNVEIGCRIG